MATSVAPLLAGVCLMVLALAASGMMGMHFLPPWLEAPLMALRHRTSVPTSAEFAGPEGVLMHQLKSVDVSHEPGKAYALNSAIGKLLRNSDAQDGRVVHHFEAARDAAARSSDPDTLLAAHMDLAEAYGEQGRPLDAQQQLTVATSIMPNHFAEHGFQLNRGRGLAKFQLGHTKSALSYYEQAARNAAKPDDVVRIACDSAVAQTCLGHARNSLEPLRGALEVLQEVKKAGADGTLPAALQTSLAAEVHFRLAESFHSMASDSVDADMITNSEFAEAHYKKALHLQQKSTSFKPLRISAIKNGLARLRQGLTQDLQAVPKPSLQCPKQPRAPWDPVKITDVEDPEETAFIAKINDLLIDGKYDLAVSELKATLKAHPRPYKSLKAAAALNMLGQTYRMQRNFPQAAKHFRQALQAVTACGAKAAEVAPQGAKAYEGLRDVQGKLSSAEQPVAAAALKQYRERAAKLGIPVYEPEGKEDPTPPSAHTILLL